MREYVYLDFTYVINSLNMRLFLMISIVFSSVTAGYSQNKRVRDYGIQIGILRPGQHNAITDVKGVKIGHVTLMEGTHIRTGVTAILPHSGNVFQEKVPAAIYLGNGFGKLAGYSQVKELGNIETPVILTNTLSVAAAVEGVVTHTIRQPGNEDILSVNAVVGETNDGWLNDIRGRHVQPQHVLEAIANAKGGPVEEGNIGAGTGTIGFRYKGGIGTSSRVIPDRQGGFTVGVLVQTNFGGVYDLNGVPVAEELGRLPASYTYDTDGSCMIVVATDAPLGSRNLERLAKRAMMGLGRTGGIASNGSGDYVIAFSVAEENRIPHSSDEAMRRVTTLENDRMSPLFLAVIEATEEAIHNSLFAAETMTGREGRIIEALPIEEVIRLMKKYNKIK